MRDFRGHRRLAAAGLISAVCLGGCATGQGSFIAGSGGPSETFQEDDGGYFEENAPGLLAASGNALLPGGRQRAGAGPVSADLNVSAGLLSGASMSLGVAAGATSVNVTTALGGPLLALNGSRTALLGVNAVGPGVLGVTPNLSLGVAGAINPATAATQTLVSATVGVATPGGPVTVPVGGGPLTPPTLGVPGTTPLQVLLPLLPTAPPAVLPGLLGQ
jgi:hypothetical protein